MKRYLFALVVAVASVSAAAAQPPVIPAPPLTPVEPPRPPFPPARWNFHPTPGIFYYDSGEYLLGGVQGLSRSTGMFTMQGPGGATFSSFGPYNGAGAAGSCATCGRRHHWR